MFHIAQSFGVSEPTVCRTIKRVEDVMFWFSRARSRVQLPGKKALSPSDTSIEVVVIDASESPIERPKKSNATSTAGKRSVTHSSLR